MALSDRDWFARPGAPDSVIQRLQSVVSRELPAAYLQLLRTSNGGEGPLPRQPFNLVLDPAEDVVEAAARKQFEEFFPGFLVIGSDGGGEFIALDLRSPGSPAVVALDMTNSDLTESVLPIAPDFDTFIDLTGVQA